MGIIDNIFNGSHRPKPPTPQPTYATLAVWVKDPAGAPIQGALVDCLSLDPPVDGTTNQDGYFSMVLEVGHSHIVEVHADHFTSVTHEVFLTGNHDEMFQLESTAPPVVISTVRRVTVTQHIFRTVDDGQPWRKKFCSAFFALQRWDRGEDCMPLVEWTHRVRGNGWRVFCQFLFANPSDPLRPRQISPQRMVEFSRWANAQGLMIGFVFKTDTQAEGFNESLQDEIDDVRNIMAALRDEPVVGEIKNEPFKNGGRIDEIVDALGLRDKANRPFPLATGNYDIVGHESSFYALDWIGDHPARKDDWPAEACKTGHFIIDGWGADANSPGWHGLKGQDVAVDADEPMGAAEVSVPGRRDANPNNHEDSGAGFAVGGSGGTNHCDDLAGGFKVPGPVQTECAERYFAAMDFFPTDAFLGTYTHDGFEDFPLVSIASHMQDAKEVAGRIVGNRAYVVAAQPSEAWRPEPQNGWRIVAQRGHRNNLLILER